MFCPKKGKLERKENGRRQFSNQKYALIIGRNAIHSAFWKNSKGKHIWLEPMPTSLGFLEMNKGRNFGTPVLFRLGQVALARAKIESFELRERVPFPPEIVLARRFRVASTHRLNSHQVMPRFFFTLG